MSPPDETSPASVNLKSWPQECFSNQMLWTEVFNNSSFHDHRSTCNCRLQNSRIFCVTLSYGCARIFWSLCNCDKHNTLVRSLRKIIASGSRRYCINDFQKKRDILYKLESDLLNGRHFVKTIFSSQIGLNRHWLYMHFCSEIECII